MPTRMVAVLLLMSGCTYGVATDTETGAGIPNIQVIISQGIFGGVTGKTWDLRADESGLFFMDALNQDGSVDLDKLIVPHPDNPYGTVEVQWRSRTTHHNWLITYEIPKYKKVQQPDGSIRLELVLTTDMSDDFTDSDWDGLSDKRELKHGTDPNNSDTDGDGIPDGCEVNGCLWNAYEGFNPRRKDILVQLDYQHVVTDTLFDSERTYTARPSPYTLAAVGKVWEDLDNVNVDGSTGMTVHWFVTNKLPAGHNCDVKFDRDKYRLPFYRKYGFYIQVCLASPRENGGVVYINQGRASADSAWVNSRSNDNPEDAPTDNGQYAVHGKLMHELGHITGGLRHGGDETRNCKLNYPSILNYPFIGWDAERNIRGSTRGFSRGLSQDFDPMHIREWDVQGVSHIATYIHRYGRNSRHFENGHAPNVTYATGSITTGKWNRIDWNRNGSTDDNGPDGKGYAHPHATSWGDIDCQEEDDVSVMSDFNDHAQINRNLRFRALLKASDGDTGFDGPSTACGF